MFEDYEPALKFATEKHKGQVRKYTNEPYINHPIAVANLVESIGGTIPMICAALLHDVVEDTDTTHPEIYQEFGATVGRYVVGLTEISKPADGNRSVRKLLDLEFLAKQPASVQTIKLADLIDNTKTIVKYDPCFAKVYMREKQDLLTVLKKGNATLYLQASEIVDDYFR